LDVEKLQETGGRFSASLISPQEALADQEESITNHGSSLPYPASPVPALQVLNTATDVSARLPWYRMFGSQYICMWIF